MGDFMYWGSNTWIQTQSHLFCLLLWARLAELTWDQEILCSIHATTKLSQENCALIKIIQCQYTQTTMEDKVT